MINLLQVGVFLILLVLFLFQLVRLLIYFGRVARESKLGILGVFSVYLRGEFYKELFYLLAICAGMFLLALWVDA